MKIIGNLNDSPPVQWDLSVRIGEQTYPIRELSLREWNDLLARKMTREEQTDAALQLMTGDTRPDREQLTDDVRQDLFNWVGGYVEGLLAKKAAAVRERVRAAMGLG